MNLNVKVIEKTQKLKALFKSDNLLSKSLRGGSILAAGSSIENLLRFIRNIILARLLAPEAFGLMATVIASITVIEAFTQIGLRQSTIQNKWGSEEGFLNAVWWISSLRGLTLYIIAFFASPFISDYFGKPDSDYLLRIGFLVILLNGLISPRVHILEKELRFKNWVILMQGSGVMGVITAIVSAFFLRNVWALLLGYIIEALLRLIMSFLFCPIRPQLRLDKKYTVEIMKFSRRMFGLPIIMMLYAQADIFVIGKVLSIQQLGTYVLVKGLSEMPVEFFSKIVHPVILPVFSAMQDERSRLTKALLSATQITGLFGIPFTAFLVLFSEPILNIVYGQEYGRLAVPFSLLCISTFIMMIASLIVQMYFAIGQPNIHRTASMARTCIFLILIYPATKIFGLTGAASATLIAILVLICVQFIYARRVIKFSLSDYLNNWLPGIKASLLIIIPGIILHIFFEYRGIGFLLMGFTLCPIAWGYGVIKTGLLRHGTILQAR